MTYPTYHPKTILITGATGDFGRTFCKRFQETNPRFLLWGRNPEKLERLKDSLSGEVKIMNCDFSDIEAIKAAWNALPQQWQDIDLLINNAGGAVGQEPAYEAQPDDWQKMIDINVTSLAILTNLVLPNMVVRGRGHIINIGSIAGSYPYPGGHVYCGVKAFVKQFSLSLRADLIGKNVRVTNIEPGMVETQFSLVRFKGDSDKAAAVYAGANPLTPEDIAESVFFAATLPEHVNINRLEVMPTTQGPGALNVHRKTVTPL